MSYRNIEFYATTQYKTLYYKAFFILLSTSPTHFNIPLSFLYLVEKAEVNNYRLLLSFSLVITNILFFYHFFKLLYFIIIQSITKAPSTHVVTIIKFDLIIW